MHGIDLVKILGSTIFRHFPNIWNRHMNTQQLKVSINYNERYANFPTLEIIMPGFKLPELEHFTFKLVEITKDGTNLYLDYSKPDFVKFFVEDRSNQHGYGGEEFKIKLDDGETYSLIGPWSGRPGIFNTEDGSIAIVQVHINNQVFHLKLDWLKYYLPQISWFMVKERDEIDYVPTEYEKRGYVQSKIQSASLSSAKILKEI